MMVTGGNGVRMQYDYTGDIAGLPGGVSAAHPRWLRLTRSGDTITGYDSADGTHWTAVGTVQLSGLPSTVQVGMFATSPGYTVTQNSFGGGSIQRRPSPGHRRLRSRQPDRLARRRHLDRHHSRRRRPGWAAARRRPGLRRRLPARGGTFTRDRVRRHRAGHAGAGQRAADGDDRAEPGRGVRGTDRDRDRGGDVLQLRVPARPDPHHAGRDAQPGRGTGRQGRGDRRGGVRRRAGCLGRLRSPSVSRGRRTRVRCC